MFFNVDTRVVVVIIMATTPPNDSKEMGLG